MSEVRATSMTQPEVYYRYEDFRYAAPLNEYDEPSGSSTLGTRLNTYKVIKHTPKGVFIQYRDRYGHGDTRFIRHDARKKFAHPTELEALASFMARKERQIRILRHQHDHAVEAKTWALCKYREMSAPEHKPEDLIG